MRLKYTPHTFTPQAWKSVFGAFIMANRSHWRGAPYDAVMQLLKAKGSFEFKVQAMGTWTSKFTLTVLDDGHLDADLVPNEDLSPMMRRHLERMRQEFHKDLAKL